MTIGNIPLEIVTIVENNILSYQTIFYANIYPKSVDLSKS
jgi:hypothetical protein